jgi:peptide/nickel transport system ATP-binding protein
MIAAPSKPAIVDVQRLTVAVDARPSGTQARLLQNIDFNVRESEIVGIIGHSGAGKSTLLRSILGRLPGGARVSGSVRLTLADADGVPRVIDPIGSADLRSYLGRAVAYVPQFSANNLDPVLSVGTQLVESLRVHRQLAGCDARKWAEDLADGFDLSPALLDRFPHQISGGQVQRVLLAMALAHKPALLLLDEFTSGLDPLTAERVVGALLRNRDRTAILWVSHDLRRLGSHADRLYVLEQGSVAEIMERRDGTHFIPREVDTRRMVDAALQTQRLAHAPPFANDAPCVTLEEVFAGYGPGSDILRGLSLAVRPGEVLGILGASGSGKSTILRVAAGILRIRAGRVRRDLSGNDPSFGFIAQDPIASFDPNRSIFCAFLDVARLSVWGTIVGRPSSRAVGARAAELLEQVGLDPGRVLPKLPGELSGGECQRVALARAAYHRPRLLLCDEPTAALDPVACSVQLRLIHSLRERLGCAVMLASHDVGVIARIADKVVLIDAGRFVAIASPTELIALKEDSLLGEFARIWRCHSAGWSLTPRST